MTPTLSSTLFNSLVGQKLAGHKLAKFIDSNSECGWYEGVADNTQRCLVYVYLDPTARDRERSRVHGFRTTADDFVAVGSDRLAVFLTLGDHRLVMTGELRGLLTKPDTMPTDVGNYELVRVLGHGHKGVTFQARRIAGTGTTYALKLTIAEEYEGRTPLPEVDRMVDLSEKDRDHFPQIHACGTFEYEHDGTAHALVYLVEDFIRGTTLEDLLNNQALSLTASFLHDYVEEMLSALCTLEACDLMHDDLHAGNVMLHDPVHGRRRPYLIDFGSTKPIKPTRKERDDIRNLATHIASITNAIQASVASRTAFEERVLSACEALHAKISDDDPLRRPDSARQILEEFIRSFEHGAVKQTLTHPFDFGNAEEVMDNSLLYSLAAKSFPWKDQIESSAHLLVIGPRGSGKTTVFRSMSFRCLADAGHIEDALQRRYFGVYISCNREFRQRFSALGRDVIARREDEIRHYFNLIVLREFAGALIACEGSGHLSAPDIRAFQTFVAARTSLLANSSTSERALSLKDVEATITRAIQATRMHIWKDQPVPDTTPQSLIADLTELAAGEIAPFSGKLLYLFVDDYTERKVPKEAQQALNHILFVPNATYKCKISSEVFGVTPDQTYGDFLTQDRDYKEWNLGTLYCLKLPTAQQRAFLGEIVDKRLELCNYDGRVATLIGPSEYPHGTLARSLKMEAEARKERRKKASGKPELVAERELDRDIEQAGIRAYYHGWDTICDLCTGDVSNILEVLNRMFADCNVKKPTTSRIPADSQDGVIEGYSRQYIGKVKGIPGYGEALFDIVDAFGNLSRRLLNDHPWQERGNGRRDPYQLLRIEIDEGGQPTESMLDDDGNRAWAVWKLLQRYCIFIDADEGRSRRNTLSSRVIFRRIFCPAFRISLVNSECYTVSRQHWEAFCSDPKARAEQSYRNALKLAEERRESDESGQKRLKFDSDHDGDASE